MLKLFRFITIYLILIPLWSQALPVPVVLLTDPTRPPPDLNGQSPPTPDLFILNTIIYSKDRKIAIINGEPKRVGDFVLGQKVIAIYENAVQLESANGKITLFLSGKPIKRLSYTKQKESDLCREDIDDGIRRFGN